MFKKFRRSSKVKVERQLSSATSNNGVATSSKAQTTFFSLPAELRNAIYELVANETRLQLFFQTSKSKAKAVPGLLLTSRQCRNEYTPILLSTAPIRATITDFDFSPLMRVAGSLYSTELKSLRTNNNLTISLRLKKCSNDVYANLRRWCINRASSLDRLPWTYVLEESAKGNTEQLRWFCERARVLYEKLKEEESVRAEVQRVLECLEWSLGGAAGEGLRREWSSGFGDDFVMMAAGRRQQRG